MRWKPRHIVLSTWWAISVAGLASEWQTVEQLFTHKCQNCTQVHAMPIAAKEVIQIQVDLKFKSQLPD